MNWKKIKRNIKKWIRYFYLFKPMIEGRFLYEFLVPNDILDLAKNVKVKEEVMSLTFYGNKTGYGNNSGQANPFGAPAIMPWESW